MTMTVYLHECVFVITHVLDRKYPPLSLIAGIGDP